MSIAKDVLVRTKRHGPRDVTKVEYLTNKRGPGGAINQKQLWGREKKYLEFALVTIRLTRHGLNGIDCCLPSGSTNGK
jgi:hypothetical protein